MIKKEFCYPRLGQKGWHSIVTNNEQNTFSNFTMDVRSYSPEKNIEKNNVALLERGQQPSSQFVEFHKHITFPNNAHLMALRLWLCECSKI